MTNEKNEGSKDEQKTFKITVNGRPRDVTVENLSYKDVVILAYGEAAANDEQFHFTVMYHHADQKPADGELLSGESVKIKNNTSFDVTKTIRS